MVQANDVAGTRTAFENRLDAKFREVRPVFNEVSKKRIAGSERKKSQGRRGLAWLRPEKVR